MHLPTTTTTTKQPAQYVFEESCFFIPVLIIVSCDAVWVNILNVYAAMLIFRQEFSDTSVTVLRTSLSPCPPFLLSCPFRRGIWYEISLTAFLLQQMQVMRSKLPFHTGYYFMSIDIMQDPQSNLCSRFQASLIKIIPLPS